MIFAKRKSKKSPKRPEGEFEEQKRVLMG